MITATCRTENGIEWTSLKIKADGPEPAQHGALPLSIPDGSAAEILDKLVLPDDIAEHLKGDITVAMRTSELLMRTMEFPTADPQEIADMVGFQIDKASPFPADQLAIAHEVLHFSENSATVLMAAAKRECIDAIGDTFSRHGVHIHSIDASILGWMQLIREHGELAKTGCEILIVDDGMDFSLAVLSDGLPMAFRALHAQLDDMNVVDELAYEINYTLTMLDGEHVLETPEAIQFWSFNGVPEPLQAKLTAKTGLAIHCGELSALPPLSEGIIQRALKTESHIELIPREWIDHENRVMLRKKFTLISSAIAAVWIFVLLIFFGIYKTRDLKLAGVQGRANAIAPAANQALQNRKKLKALKVYTDRSDSALECLREVTSQLPSGDIEFVSYNYSKGKGATLRGTAANDDLVNDFFVKLTKSTLFERLKDQSVNTKTTKGVRRAVFSVTLVLPAEEEDK